MNQENDIGFRLRTLSNLVKRQLHNTFSEKHADNPTIMHGWVIHYLYDNRENDIFQRDLEQQFSIRRSTATAILKLMEKNELITREPVDYDARLKKLVLTDKAVKIHKSVIKEINSLEKTLRKDISEKEMDIFLRTIDKMIDNIKQS